jgi:hypothetical protein
MNYFLCDSLLVTYPSVIHPSHLRHVFFIKIGSVSTSPVIIVVPSKGGRHVLAFDVDTKAHSTVVEFDVSSAF